jgi:hypothetical protein
MSDIRDGHDQVPENPADGDEFTCSCCGHTCTFVVLDDGLPGEWTD